MAFGRIRDREERARSLCTHAHMLRAPVLLGVLANSAIAFTPTSPRLFRPHLAAHKPKAQAARPCPRVEGARMQSGDGWQAFKSGDTWRNIFGEIGPTRYDTYLSTYRSTRQSTSKPTTRSSNRKSKSSSSGSSSNWFSSYDSGYSYYDGGSFGGGSFDSGGGFSDGGGGFSDGGGGGGADF